MTTVVLFLLCALLFPVGAVVVLGLLSFLLDLGVNGLPESEPMRRGNKS